jgi:hypothetical protein
LAAGIDVELPHTRCYGEPLGEAVRAGAVPEDLVDRAARRVLRQKGELGLLDPGWTPTVPDGPLDIDPPEHRALARELAERSIVLLANDGTLPLRPGQLALVGPCAADPLAFLGCYSYPNHGVMAGHPDMGLGVEVPTLIDALGHALYAPGCDVMDDDPTMLVAAVEAASAAELCVCAVGDRPGLFGRGTSGEGCDAEDLSLPGIQDELVEALIETGTPIVLVVISGRPYALGRYEGRVAAMVQAFLPGEEGAAAIAGVLTGEVMPTGRLPVQVPRVAGAQPSTYLHPILGGNSEGVSNLDPTPLFAFGHGLSYTTFSYSDCVIGADEIATHGSVEVSCVVRNAGERAGAEVVQLYLSGPVAPVTRPVTQLAGFLRVELDAGEAARITFTLHADRTAFTTVDLRRIVQPGEIGIALGASAADIRGRLALRLVGEEREVGHDRVLTTPASRSPV